MVEIEFPIHRIADQTVVAGIPQIGLGNTFEVGDIWDHKVISMTGRRDQILQEPLSKIVGNGQEFLSNIIESGLTKVHHSPVLLDSFRSLLVVDPVPSPVLGRDKLGGINPHKVCEFMVEIILLTLARVKQKYIVGDIFVVDLKIGESLVSAAPGLIDFRSQEFHLFLIKRGLAQSGQREMES